MGTTARAGITYDDLTHLADLPAALKTPLDQIDASIGAPDCTSVARPTTGLYVGYLAYETDTDLLIRYNGAGWDYIAAGVWHSYTPTVSGITGDVTGSEWRQVANGIDFRISFVASGAATGTINFTLPTATKSYPAMLLTFGTAFARDVSAGQYWAGHAAVVNGTAGPTNTVYVYLPANSTTTTAATASTSTPFTWAANDTISIFGSYALS